MNDKPSAKPWVVVVGGFLGAGKTTLLLAAAKELEARGFRSAIVLNDQGEALVDTEYASIHGLQRGELTGGCFCCRFSELVSVMDELRDFSPYVIFAESVGSCTDISATTLQPLREYSDTYRLAPFTVLVDPSRGKELLRDDAEPNLKFLFTKQLQEADVVCFTKADVKSDFPEIDGPPPRHVSAKTGQGVAAWLDEMLSGTISTGSQILDIDYEQYARAEAALAWLNLQVDIRPRAPLSSGMVLGPLLDQLDADFTAADISIVHLKAIMNSPSGFLKAAICANGQEPILEGALDASPSSNHSLLLNLRAVGTADQARAIVEQNLRGMNAQLSDLQINCFHPAPSEAGTPDRRSTMKHPASEPPGRSAGSSRSIADAGGEPGNGRVSHSLPLNPAAIPYPSAWRPRALAPPCYWPLLLARALWVNAWQMEISQLLYWRIPSQRELHWLRSSWRSDPFRVLISIRP